MVRDEPAIARVGLTLHCTAMPGDLLVSVDNANRENVYGVVTARGEADMQGIHVRPDGEMVEWLPSAGWCVSYRSVL